MKKLEEIIIKSLKELVVEKYKSQINYPKFIRDTLKSIYEPLGLWGQAPNPNDDCETNFGVINIFPHSEQDSWSVLNRFDTNTKVKSKIDELFTRYSRSSHSERDFYDWIEKNKFKLFGPDGKYTEQLVALNMDTIISGNRNEEFAVEILQDKFPGVTIKRFCSGDIRDTKKGIDITVEHPSNPFNVQVKPFDSVNSFVEPDGDTFFEVKSYLKVNNYSEKNVNVFMFVNVDIKQYILFRNKKTKIGQMAYNIIRFYEAPLYTNKVFETKEKRRFKKVDPTISIFGIETDNLKNLEFRKNQIEKQIEKQRAKEIK